MLNRMMSSNEKFTQTSMLYSSQRQQGAPKCQYHNPEDLNSNLHCYENLKSCIHVLGGIQTHVP